MGAPSNGRTIFQIKSKWEPAMGEGAASPGKGRVKPDVFNEWSTGHGLFTHRGHFYTKQIQKDKSIIFVAAEPKNI